MTGSTYLNDLRAFRVFDMTWETLVSAGPQPARRAFMGLTTAFGFIYLFGGADGPGTFITF